VGKIGDERALGALQHTVEQDTGGLDGRLSIREAATKAIEQIKHRRSA
jgi:hypothetical protein